MPPRPLPRTMLTKSKVKELPRHRAGLAAKIDEYLSSRESPMAGLGKTFVQAGHAYGVDPRMLVGIGVIESGAGAHERNPNNFANWGIHRGVQYKDHAEAIQSLAKGLRDGYISQGLRTPRQIVSRYAPASDNNDEGNWASVVSQVMGRIGGQVPRELTGRGGRGFSPPVTLSPRTPEMGKPTPFRSFLRDSLISTLGESGPMDLFGAVSSARSEFLRQPPPAPAIGPRYALNVPAPAGGINQPKMPPATAKGGFLQAPTSWSGTHVTDGLDLNHGHKTAEDIMAAPGTQVGAPEAGTIIRHGSAQGGQALYFQSDSGHLYWMGHIEGMAPVGTRVERGTPIAVISSDHAAPHLHIDKR